MAVSFGTMDWISGGVIAALVLLNVTVGAYTEWQAEKVSSPFWPCYQTDLDLQLTCDKDRRISRISRSTTSHRRPPQVRRS
jgi:hypothetical protein